MIIPADTRYREAKKKKEREKKKKRKMKTTNKHTKNLEMTSARRLHFVSDSNIQCTISLLTCNLTPRHN